MRPGFKFKGRQSLVVEPNPAPTAYSVGVHHRHLLKRKLAMYRFHQFGGLSKDFFIRLQKNLRAQPTFINHGLLKEAALVKIRKAGGFKNSRIEKNLPLRGQRTHTNAKTRKKRKVL